MYLLIPAGIILVGGLLWTWWSGRSGRDPVSSISSFHRALEAMQPGTPRRGDEDDEVAANP